MACARAKEFLSRKGIDYENVDVLNDASGRERLLAHLTLRGYTEHTLVDQAVTAARTRTPAAAKFVNAVLDRAARRLRAAEQAATGRARA